MQKRLFLGFLIGFGLAPPLARADQGEVSLGLAAQATWPGGGRAGLAARWGLGDWLAVDGRVLAGISDDAVVGVGSGGLVLAWDVLTWVPEVRAAVGARLDGDGGVPWLGMALALRRYVSWSWSLGPTVSGEWTPRGWGCGVGLTVWLSLS